MAHWYFYVPERERDKEREKVQAIIFLNCPGEN
jgi:hypothetical protein